MKILIIGGGGREHAIAWKLRQSVHVEKIWCAPGNGGISRDAECVALNVGDVKAAADLAKKLGADLTIVGPELPLVQGIADEFKQRGLAILGPPKSAAQLEGSKIFAKEFMTRNGIPTAAVYGACDSALEACAKLDSVSWPVVVKADGLCAGKGVLVTSSANEAKKFIERLTNSDEFGEAGKRVLLEEALEGKELSYIILTDGTNFISLAPTRDHKRAFDHDEGPNTGGMGTYSTDEMLARELEEEILKEIVRPTLTGLRTAGMEYRGFIFFGLMLTKDGPKVLEYNCRLGDPETQAILLRADFDFAAVCIECGAREARWVEREVDSRGQRLCGAGVGGVPVQSRFGQADHRAGGSGEGTQCGCVSRGDTARRGQLLHEWWTNSRRCGYWRVGRSDPRGCLRRG